MTRCIFKKIFIAIVFSLFLINGIGAEAVSPPPAFIGTWHVEVPSAISGVRMFGIIEISENGTMLQSFRFSGLESLDATIGSAQLRSFENRLIFYRITSVSSSQITVVSDMATEIIRLVGGYLVFYNTRYTRGQPSVQ